MCTLFNNRPSIWFTRFNTTFCIISINLLSLQFLPFYIFFIITCLSQQAVDHEMRYAFPEGAVDQVHMVYDQEELGKTYAKYTATQQKLEDLFDLYTSLRRRGKVIKRTTAWVIPTTVGPWAVEKYGKKPLKADALEYNTLLLDQLYQQLLEEQRHSKERPTSSAFVTFR